MLPAPTIGVIGSVISSETSKFNTNTMKSCYRPIYKRVDAVMCTGNTQSLIHAAY